MKRPMPSHLTRGDPASDPFVIHHRRYDAWFERHGAAYLSELLAVRALLPCGGPGLEIGVGTGRFAAPLGVEFGVDPAASVLAYARARGVRVARAVAEALPFAQAAFDRALFVTTLCFVADPRAALAEAMRVLRPSGTLVIGLIDRESGLGQEYAAHRDRDIFYRGARFHSAAEVADRLAEAGFGEPTWQQTLTVPPGELRKIEPARPGTGRGAFLAVRATRLGP